MTDFFTKPKVSQLAKSCNSDLFKERPHHWWDFFFSIQASLGISAVLTVVAMATDSSLPSGLITGVLAGVVHFVVSILIKRCPWPPTVSGCLKGAAVNFGRFAVCDVGAGIGDAFANSINKIFNLNSRKVFTPEQVQKDLEGQSAPDSDFAYTLPLCYDWVQTASGQSECRKTQAAAQEPGGKTKGDDPSCVSYITTFSGKTVGGVQVPGMDRKCGKELSPEAVHDKTIAYNKNVEEAKAKFAAGFMSIFGGTGPPPSWLMNQIKVH